MIGISNSLQILENVPLAPLTTLKIGGPARFFVVARTESDVIDAFRHAGANGLDLFILGGGSNLLVADEGFDGLVIQIALKGVERDGEIIRVAAGEDWDSFVSFCVKNDLAGVECLSGIPGFVGGTPIQNVGAYGQEVSETILSVTCLDRTTRELVELTNDNCGFTYRKSIFNSTERDRYVVLSVTYRLTQSGSPNIRYKDLKNEFGDREPTLAEVRETVLRIRRSKSMVIDESDPNSRSAGSFFKNPIVDRAKFDDIASQSAGATVPSFPAGEDHVKIPAAWLIERAGFSKGFRFGNVGISANHSLAIVNLGGGSAAEVLALKEKIQAGVEQKFDILLQHEPVFVGFE